MDGTRGVERTKAGLAPGLVIEAQRRHLRVRGCLRAEASCTGVKGKTARTVVERPGVEVTSSEPPTVVRRSDMPASP